MPKVWGGCVDLIYHIWTEWLEFTQAYTFLHHHKDLQHSFSKCSIGNCKRFLKAHQTTRSTVVLHKFVEKSRLEWLSNMCSLLFIAIIVLFVFTKYISKSHFTIVGHLHVMFALWNPIPDIYFHVWRVCYGIIALLSRTLFLPDWGSKVFISVTPILFI